MRMHKLKARHPAGFFLACFTGGAAFAKLWGMNHNDTAKTFPAWLRANSITWGELCTTQQYRVWFAFLLECKGALDA